MKHNNLHVVRLMAAFLVLFGHSFVFLGMREPLFLSWLPLGPLGVYTFFIISGYLVSASWDRDPNLWRYFARRGLRIFPALAMCVVLSVLVFGPLLTTLSLQDYFANPHTLGYLRNIGLYITYYLPGIFETNRVPNAVNGSLWSLPVEFTMYIMVGILGLIGSNRWVFLALGLMSAIINVCWAWETDKMWVVYAFDLRQVFICGTYFWAGALFFKFNCRRYFSLSGTLMAAAALLCLEPWAHVLQIAAWILLPVVVLSFALSHSPLLERLTRNGDYSYGFYLYAFPVQQAVVYLYPKIKIVEYVAVCSVVTLFFAVLSWHMIERRVLLLKPRHPNFADPTGVIGY
jgi:peptidoglycan/LPS O-acetylase OafA/YrhL